MPVYQFPNGHKLGRIRPKSRPNVLRFNAYFDPTTMATPPPETVDWAKKAMTSVDKVYLNDQYGDCVIAGKYHSVGIWSANDGPETVLGTDNEVYSMYQTICGPGDNGCVISDVLDYFKDRGLPFNGVIHKIDGYVTIDWTNKLETQVALYLFGTLSLGINLPGSWSGSSKIWDVTNSGIVGGHDVTACGYNSQGVQIASWGDIYTITWAAFTSTRWLDECYLPLSPDWYGNDKLSPNGIHVDQLRDDLEKLGGGTIPPLEPPEPPVPPVVVPTTPYTLRLGANLPAGVCMIHCGDVVIQAAFSSPLTVGDYLTTHKDPLPPGQ